MHAVWMRVRGRVRHRWWATVWIALAVALVSGAVVTVVAGARRTASSPDRYTASVGGEVDALVEQRSGRPLTDRIAALPAVDRLAAYTFVFGGLESDRLEVPESLIAFTGTRPLSSRIVAGRDPDPGNPHEFVIDTSFTNATHARVGDQFQFGSLSRKQAASGEGFAVEPQGAAFDATLVGVIDSPDRLNGESFTVAVFSKALLDEDVGTVATEMQVQLRPGFSRRDLRTQLDTVKGGTALAVEPGRVVGEDVRNAVDAQAKGLWLMALVLAVAALVALGQLLARSRAARRPRARAAGRVGIHTPPTGARKPAGRGVAGAARHRGGSRDSRSRAPGSSRPDSPERSSRTPASSSTSSRSAIAAGALLVGLLVWVGVAALLDERVRTRPVRTARRFALLDRVPSTAGAVGVRFALTCGDRRAPPYGTLVALAAVIALVLGASTFAASVDHLVSEGDRFGQNYSFMVGDDGSDHTPAELRAAVVPDNDVAGVMILSEGSARVANSTMTIDVIGVDRAKGDLAPRVLAGRLPEAPDEIALGRVTAADVSRHVGDQLRLEGANGKGLYRVVGIAIVPGLAGGDGVGMGGIVVPAGFARLQRASETNAAAFTLRAGVPRAKALQTIGQKVQSQPGREDTPVVIANVERVRSVPAVLAALLAVLVLLTLLHALFMSIRNRRHDLAILKSLGANRRWITRVVHSQATLLAAAPAGRRAADRARVGIPGVRRLRQSDRRAARPRDPRRDHCVDLGRARGAREPRSRRARPSCPPHLDRGTPPRRVVPRARI